MQAAGFTSTDLCVQWGGGAMTSRCHCMREEATSLIDKLFSIPWQALVRTKAEGLDLARFP